MASENIPVTSQPVAPAAPKSDEKGSNNVSAASLHAMLVQGQKAKEAPAAETEAVAPDSPQTGVPEEAQDTPKAEGQEVEAASQEDASTDEPKADEESSLTDHKLSPEVQAKVDKRIGKEVAKTKSEAEARKAAEAKALALEARLAEIDKIQAQPAVVFAPTPDNPLADIQDRKSLDARYKETREIKRWAEDTLDSETINDGVKVGDKTLSKKDVKDILRNATRSIEEHFPQRAQFLQAKEAADQRARSVFTWMGDKSSPEYQQAQAALREFPWLANVPNAHEIIGIQILGQQKLAEMQAAKKGAPAPKAKPPASQTSVSSPGTPVRASEDSIRVKQTKAELETMKSSKRNFSSSDAVAYLKKSQVLNSR